MYKSHIDISVAVATPKGLVVPVIRGCEQKTWADLEKVKKRMKTQQENPGERRRDQEGGRENKKGRKKARDEASLHQSRQLVNIEDPQLYIHLYTYPVLYTDLCADIYIHIHLWRERFFSLALFFLSLCMSDVRGAVWDFGLGSSGEKKRKKVKERKADRRHATCLPLSFFLGGGVGLVGRPVCLSSISLLVYTYPR